MNTCRILVHVLMAVAVCLMGAGVGAALTCSMSYTDAVFIPDNGTLLGVAYNPIESEQDIKDLQSFEDWSEKKYSVVIIFQGFSPDEQSPFPKNQLDNLWQNGNTPLLTLEPWGQDILDVINNETFNPYFEEYAQDMKNWTQESWTVDNKTGTKKQLFLRFAHEMNLHDDAYPWSNKSPASYKNAWKRVHNIFEEQGLTSDDVQWIWCVNNYDVPLDGYKAEEYYPGDEYVDWVAIDGYNAGKSVPCADWDYWASFDDTFMSMLDRFGNHSNISKKPYAITEFASSSVVNSIPVEEFNVYTNKDSPTNHYVPSGWWGDWGDIMFYDDDRSSPHLGIACGNNTSDKLVYSAEGSQGNGWAGICWQEGGYNLTGANNITFWARGGYGGEKAEFSAGDVGASTGVVALTSTWQRYIIDLAGMDMSHVVRGFYWGTSDDDNPNGCTIYLDDIRYESSTGIKDVCVEEGVSNNTRKGEWVTETYNSIKNHPNVKMVCYFNVDKGGTKYLTGESDWAVFTTLRDNTENVDDCSFDPNKRIPQYNESIKDDHYVYKFPLYLEDTQDVSLVFAITPNSRIAQIGTPVTIFLSAINSCTANATGVSIAQTSSLPATVSYQPWDGAALTDSPDTPVDIPAGETAHFVLTINATAEFDSSPMTFNVSGTNAAAAPISSVNTLTISASAVPYADIIMMSTSLDMGMTVNTAAAFALATSNVGSADATGVSLIVDVPDAITGLAYQVNETYPDGNIKGPAAGLNIPVGGQPTFAVFLTPTQAIDSDPANNRIVLKLVDGSGKVIGAQSVAVATA